MNNWNYLYAVCTVVFLGLFTYTWLMASRQKQLEEKVNDLREQLKDMRR
jgi:CcmD family protein